MSGSTKTTVVIVAVLALAVIGYFTYMGNRTSTQPTLSGDGSTDRGWNDRSPATSSPTSTTDTDADAAVGDDADLAARVRRYVEGVGTPPPGSASPAAPASEPNPLTAPAAASTGSAATAAADPAGPTTLVFDRQPPMLAATDSRPLPTTPATPTTPAAQAVPTVGSAAVDPAPSSLNPVTSDAPSLGTGTLSSSPSSPSLSSGLLLPPPIDTGSPAHTAGTAGPTLAATYTIQSGDTLSSLAVTHYGSERYWVEIAQANPTVDPHRLKIGQVIKLPSPSQVQVPPAADASDDPPVGDGVIYQVKPGDSLWSIARQYYGNGELWREIHQANRSLIGNDPQKVRVGMKLRIPPAPQPAGDQR